MKRTESAYDTDDSDVAPRSVFVGSVIFVEESHDALVSRLRDGRSVHIWSGSLDVLHICDDMSSILAHEVEMSWKAAIPYINKTGWRPLSCWRVNVLVLQKWTWTYAVGPAFLPLTSLPCMLTPFPIYAYIHTTSTGTRTRQESPDLPLESLGVADASSLC